MSIKGLLGKFIELAIEKLIFSSRGNYESTWTEVLQKN